MNKRVAVIIVFLFCALVVGLVAYIYKQNMYVSPAAYDEAVAAFNDNDTAAVIKSLEGKAKNTDERILLASAYLQMGSLELREEDGFRLAKPLLDQVLSENAQDSEALRLMAYGYEIIEDYTNSLAYYDRAITADISNAAAYSGKAHALALMGNVDEAIRQYQLALSVDATLDHAQLGLARLYIKEDINEDKVKEYLDLVIANSPNKRFIAEASQLWASSLMIQGEFVEAVDYFDRAIATDPMLAQAYVGRAQALFAEFQENSSDSEEAFTEIMRDIEKATEINPNLTIAYYTAGTLMEYNGQKEISDALYIQALAVVDNDISLSADEKVSMRAVIDERMK